jgi:polyisoprenoid-binding protein YceI
LGKPVKVAGGWDNTDRDGKKGELSGEILLDEKGQPKQIKTEIQIKSIWTEHDALTGVMFTGGFFDAEKHPVASFVSTAITTGAPAGTVFSNATHTVEGNFTLNGITKSISFPAQIDSTAVGFKLKGKFGLDRQEFNCKLLNSPAGVLLGDKDIENQLAMTVTVDATSAAAAGTSEGPKVAKVVDVASLAQKYTETIKPTQVQFDMVLVKGDATAGIKPFYIGVKEVTWDEFMPWVTCKDVADVDEHGKLRGKKLRPSLPYTDVTRGFGINGYPALSMSRLSAELYCKWLSQQTGKNYRLPTEAEWEFAFVAGRGSSAPLSKEEAKEAAAFEPNTTAPRRQVP